jgi:hypothetical protein
MKTAGTNAGGEKESCRMITASFAEHLQHNEKQERSTEPAAKQ